MKTILGRTEERWPAIAIVGKMTDFDYAAYLRRAREEVELTD